MKTLFIYYTDTGNGKLVAERLRERGFAIRRAIPEKELPSAFAAKILAGGFLAGIGKKTPLSGFDADVSAYDRVVIGSPIWNGRTACPINTVLANCDLDGKKVSFVLWSGSGSAPRAESTLRARFPGAEIVQLKEPKKYPSELEKLAALAEQKA